MRTALLSIVIVLLLLGHSPAADWPQWLGPNRDSVWREDGLVDRFPAEGLKVLWRTPVAYGYAGPAVADGKVYVMDYEVRSGEVRNDPGGRSKLEGRERVLCLDAASGRILWKHEYDRPYGISYPGGPRCTPTVAGGKVYALGAEGNLWCLDARTGRVAWSKDFVTDYQAPTPIWGVAAHPLVEGNAVICMVGGPGSATVAFDKDTGRELWRALTASEPGYCAPSMIDLAGRRQLVVWHAESVQGLDPATANVLWSVNVKPRFGMAIAPPRALGPFLLASCYGDAALLKFADGRTEPEIVWRGEPKTGLFAANVAPFLEDGMIYGCDIETGALMGVRLETGERLWETFQPTMGGTRRQRYGTAFLVKHADRFFLFNEQGDLLLARLSPQGYEEISRFHVLEPTNSTFGRPVVWSHPAFAQRCVFARNDKEIVCVSVARE